MKRAIYAGSFDPITNGHLDIIERAGKLFSEIIVAVAESSDKTPFFSLDKRLELIKDVVRDNEGIQVTSFKGLLIHYAQSVDTYTIIRGLRAVSDFDFEFQMSLTNRHLEEKIDTVFLMTDAKYSFLSASLVRQVALNHGDVSKFVPSVVEKELKKVLNE